MKESRRVTWLRVWGCLLCTSVVVGGLVRPALATEKPARPPCQDQTPKCLDAIEDYLKRQAANGQGPTIKATPTDVRPPASVQSRPPSRSHPALPPPSPPVTPPSLSAPRPEVIYQGPSLQDLEALANNVLGARDTARARNDQAQLQRAELRSTRMLGYILTITGNCEQSTEAARTTGRASCAESEPFDERIVGRWLGMKHYKTLIAEAKRQGWNDWEASAIFAMAAQAQGDLAGLRRRVVEEQQTLTDEKTKALITEKVLPAAAKGFSDLKAAFEGISQLERAEVMLVVLRAALPGARKRPEAHIKLSEADSIPLTGTAAEAKKHFFYALKQVLTATTGTGVCDSAAPNSTCAAGQFDAELVLTFSPSTDTLRVGADLKLRTTDESADLRSVGPDKPNPVTISLTKSSLDCDDDGRLAARAVTAAWAVMKEVEWKYNNILGDVPHLRIASGTITQALHQGVQVDEISSSQARVKHRGPVLLVESACSPSEFLERFKSRVQSEFGRSLVTGPQQVADRLTLRLTADQATLQRLKDDPDVQTGVLQGARPNLKDDNWCLAELSEAGKVHYRALVYVPGPTLTADAGNDLGTYVGARLARYQQYAGEAAVKNATAASSNQGTRRPPVVKSSGWFALAFAGAPYIQDSRSRMWAEVVPSVIDGALLAGAGVSLAVAVNERNAYAMDLQPGTKDKATAALNTGIGLGIAWLAFRIASGTLYEAWPKAWQKTEGR